MSDFKKECEKCLELQKEMDTCPFCGGNPQITHFEHGGYWPTCEGCDAMIGRIFETPEEAVEVWNRRRRE